MNLNERWEELKIQINHEIREAQESHHHSTMYYNYVTTAFNLIRESILKRVLDIMKKIEGE